MITYKIIAVFNGITKEFNFRKYEKDEAIAMYKNIQLRADRCKLIYIDREYEETWYDISTKY